MDLPPVPYLDVSVEVTRCGIETYVAAGEITSLKHELGNDTVESRPSVTEALLASAESTEVLGRLGDVFVIEDEVDATGLLCEDPCQLHCAKWRGFFRSKWDDTTTVNNAS